MSSWIEKLANKGRKGGNGVLVQISREVVGRKRSINGAISEVRHPAVLDALSDDDFAILGDIIDERIDSDREFAQVLARLTHAAAHAKGFDRQTVDAALKLDALLPAEDPADAFFDLCHQAAGLRKRGGHSGRSDSPRSSRTEEPVPLWRRHTAGRRQAPHPIHERRIPEYTKQHHARAHVYRRIGFVARRAVAALVRE